MPDYEVHSTPTLSPFNMRLGLIGWGTASGNGGMNTDIASLAPFVTKWLIPDHPKLPLHDPYIMKARQNTELFFSTLDEKPGNLDTFFSNIDGLLYIEHPIYRKNHFCNFDIIEECDLRRIPTFGIPMWEWWPEEEEWALRTSALWAVTQYTNNYLSSLAYVLESRGLSPRWRNKVFGCKWGINSDEFAFRLRKQIVNIAYVLGNAGYKNRKAGEITIPTLVNLAEQGIPISIYSQSDLSSYGISCSNINIKATTFPMRKDVYVDGDLFVFPSYWEGLCHGLYEASYSGALVITTNTAPMNECLPAITIPVDQIKDEHIGKKIKKAIPSMEALKHIIKSLYGSECSDISQASHDWVARERDLKNTLLDLYNSFAPLL
jgi:glycosyltransferase involved in cell wall biosynthesis